MVNVLDVARYIINYSNEKHYGVSNLRLQKLLYFVQAYYLAFTESHEPCFEAPIEAWDFGPVVSEVYHKFRGYGSGNIPTVNYYVEFSSEDIWSGSIKPFDEKCIPEEDRKIIRDVVDGFSNYSTSALVELTHNQTPWRRAYNRARNSVITQKSIKEYFS